MFESLAMQLRCFASVLIAALACQAGGAASADETRFYEENGITYQETKRKVARPITETRWEDRQQTVYREKITCQCTDVPRSYYVQTTTLEPEAYWVNRWNPFRQPYVAQRMVPRTRWEVRNDTIKVPNPRRELVPETVAVRVPTTSTRMVEEEFISRVAVSSRPIGANTANLAATPIVGQPTLATRYATGPVSTAGGVVAGGAVVGGVARLDSDPPRAGNNDAWRPAAPLRR